MFKLHAYFYKIMYSVNTFNAYVYNACVLTSMNDLTQHSKFI